MNAVYALYRDGNAAQQAHIRIDADLGPIYVDPGQARRLSVAPGGKGVPPKPCEGEQIPRQGSNGQGDHQGDRHDLEEASLAEPQNGFVQPRDVLLLTDH